MRRMFVVLFFLMLADTANATSSKVLWQGLLDTANKGDILLFSACDGSENIPPVECSAQVVEDATFGLLQGVGFGFFQHAALVIDIGEDYIEVLHATGRKYGVITSKYHLRDFHPSIKRLQLVKINEVSQTVKNSLVQQSINRWNRTDYDTALKANNGRVYCSELIWNAYRDYADIDLTEDASNYGTFLLPLILITPDQILLSKHASAAYAMFTFNPSDISFLSSITLSLLDGQNEIEVDEPDITSGLLAHYTFENNALDVTGNGHNGEEFGNVEYVDGVLGKAINLEDDSDYIGVEKDLNLDEFTVSFLFNANEKASINNIFLSGVNQITDNELLFAWLSNNLLELGAAGLVPPRTTNSFDFTGRWNHLSFSVSSGSAKVYVNGELTDTLSSSSYNQLLNVEYLTIGRDQDCLRGCFQDGQTLKGKLDDLRIYDRALTDEQITQLYSQYSSDGELPVSTEDLIIDDWQAPSLLDN